MCWVIMRQVATYDRPNETSKTLTLHTNVDLLARPSTRSHYLVILNQSDWTKILQNAGQKGKKTKQNKETGFLTFYQEEPCFCPCICFMLTPNSRHHFHIIWETRAGDSIQKGRGGTWKAPFWGILNGLESSDCHVDAVVLRLAAVWQQCPSAATTGSELRLLSFISNCFTDCCA